MQHHLLFTFFYLSAFWGPLFVFSQESNVPTLDDLKSISYPVLLDSTQPPDWEKTGNAIGDKRIVLIGEPNHGSEEIFRLRNDLIQYLHEQKGFKVLLVESGLGEQIHVNFNKPQLSPTQMTYGLFGPWRNAAFRDLMEYVKKVDLSIAGYDVQRTGRSFDGILKAELEKFDVDKSIYIDLEDRFTLANQKLRNRNAVYDSVKTEIERLMGDYMLLQEQLLALLEAKTSLPGQFIIKTLGNRIFFLEYRLEFLQDQNWSKRWAARDQAMADNVVWLKDEIFPNEKLIIIGHNFHLAKSNPSELVMGKFLKDVYPDELFVIGTFAGGGSYKDNYGKVKTMTAPETKRLDIKLVIKQFPALVNFVDIPQEKSLPNEWLFKPIVVKDTFIDLKGTDQMTLAKLFDGLLVLKRVSPSK